MKKLTILWIVLGPIGLVFWWMMLYYAPREATMGDVQRIFYMHLPLAWVGMLSFLLSAIPHVLYLKHRDDRYLHWGWAFVRTGVFMTLTAIFLGMLWAKPIWNSWWPRDPRLTTTFLMMLMYAAYLFLYDIFRKNPHPEALCWYNFVSLVNIPLVAMAPRIARSLHPVLFKTKGFALDAKMWHTVLVGTIWMLLFGILLVYITKEFETYRSTLEHEAFQRRT